MVVMVSECLLGHSCKYTVGNNLHNKEAGFNVVDVEDEECWTNFLNPRSF